MRSFLEPQGLYDPTKRFAFTNITDEDFTSHWNGVPVIVKAGDTIEISNVTPIPGAGHALAVKMTIEMVDKIMIGAAKLDEVAKNQPYYRSPQAPSLGVPAARKVWEDQILREMDAEEESPAIQSMRKQMIEEITRGATENPTTAPVQIPTSITEFAELGNPQVKEPKKAAKVKSIKA